jgi:hypothetical protein
MGAMSAKAGLTRRTAVSRASPDDPSGEIMPCRGFATGALLNGAFTMMGNRTLWDRNSPPKGFQRPAFGARHCKSAEGGSQCFRHDASEAPRPEEPDALA